MVSNIPVAARLTLQTQQQAWRSTQLLVTTSAHLRIAGHIRLVQHITTAISASYCIADCETCISDTKLASVAHNQSVGRM